MSTGDVSTTWMDAAGAPALRKFTPTTAVLPVTRRQATEPSIGAGNWGKISVKVPPGFSPDGPLCASSSSVASPILGSWKRVTVPTAESPAVTCAAAPDGAASSSPRRTNMTAATDGTRFIGTPSATPVPYVPRGLHPATSRVKCSIIWGEGR
jgi:hypothetical protein